MIIIMDGISVNSYPRFGRISKKTVITQIPLITHITIAHYTPISTEIVTFCPVIVDMNLIKHNVNSIGMI